MLHGHTQETDVGDEAGGHAGNGPPATPCPGDDCDAARRDHDGIPDEHLTRAGGP